MTQRQSPLGGAVLRAIVMLWIVVCVSVMLSACGGGSPEIPPGDVNDNGQLPPGNNAGGDNSGGDNSGGDNNGGENNDGGSNNDGGNNQGPGAGSPVVINLGNDEIYQGFEEVRIAAGQTNATRLEWSQIGNGPRVNLINTDQFQVRFPPPNFADSTDEQSRRITLRLTGWDEQGNSASDDIDVIFSSVVQTNTDNAPPVIEDIADVIAQPGEVISLSATATDPDSADGQPQIKWSQRSAAPLVLGTTELTSPTISFTAPTEKTKIWFIVKAFDGAGAADYTDVLIEVMGNLPPTANAGGDLSAVPGQLVTIQGSGNDTDGSISGYLWEQVVDGSPIFSLQDATTANVSFTAPDVSIATDITLRLTVTDDMGASASDDVVISVNPSLVNVPPTANAGNDQVARLGDVVTLLGSAVDEDGTVDNYLWTQLDGPAVTLTGTNSPVVSFTMPPDIPGQSIVTLQLTVTDNQNATGTDQVNILANSPPVANAGQDHTVRPGDTVNLLGSGEDADGNIVSYAWTQIAGQPTVSINNNSANTSFVAPDITGSLSFELTVTDNQGATGSAIVNIDIAANIPPTANAGQDIVVAVGDPGPVMIDGSNSSDSDGNIVSYSWAKVAGPEVVLSGASTPIVSFEIPAVQQLSIITLQLTVEDDAGGTSTDEVNITIQGPPTNSAPSANAGADQVVNAGAAVTLSGLGTDDDNDPLTYSWSQISGPGVVNLTNSNQSVAGFTAPNVTAVANITMELTVTDVNGATGTDQVVITVQPANLPPVVDVGTDQVALPGNNVSITGNASDPDGQIVQYTWTKISGPVVTLNNVNTPTVDFIAPDVTQSSQLHLRLTVIDNQGASASDDIFILINLASAPIVSVGADITVTAGDNVSITGNVAAAGSLIATIWTQESGTPLLTLNDQSTTTVNFVAPNVGVITEYILRLTAIDETAAVGFDELVVTVLPAGGSSNIAPTANAGPNQVVTAGDSVIINGSGSDSDGSIDSYSWSQVNGVNVTLVDANTSSVNFIAPQVSSQSTITLRLTVTDNLGATGNDDVLITVNPSVANVPPTANAGPNMTVDAGQGVTLNGSGNDPDGTIASYSWSQLSGVPVSLSNTSNALLQFNAPSVTQTGTATLRLTVTDNQGATAFDDVVITINPLPVANVPPSANAGPDLSVIAGEPVVISGAGEDSDGSIANYLWTQINGLPLSLNNVITPTVDFIAPPIQTIGTATLRLTVTDNLGATGFDEVVITITPVNVNQLPVADAGPDKSVNSSDFVTLTGGGSDPDGTIVSFQWSQSSGTPVAINNATTANANFSAPNVTAATSLSFQLTVTDNAGDTHSDELMVSVFPLTQLSGTITTQSGSQVDSDVNDPSASLASNSTPAEAQPLINPVILGGYVNVPGAGAPGTSQNSGDIDDYFSISLSANQLINLYIGDMGDTTSPNPTNDLNLILLDETGATVIDASASPTASVESLVVPATGNYLINVRAIDGASNYVLSVGVGNLAAQSNGWRLSDDFEPGDVIVQFDDGGGNTNTIQAQGLSSRAAAVGMQAKAGAPGRNMLLGLGNASQKAAAFGKLGISNVQSMTQSTAPSTTQTNAQAIVPAALQEKWDTLQAASALAKRADVIEAGLNYRYYPTAVPNDTNYNFQWHYPNINLPQAWDTTTGSSNVIVAVIDTGVLLNHPDLQGQLVPGYDFIADNANSGDGEPGIDSNPDDPGDGGATNNSSFHGTHVAGTIAAASNNNAGVAGIAWGAKIMPCRAVGINGGLRYDIEQCVRFVSGLPNDSGTTPAQPADIINLSLGGPTNTTSAPTAYQLARQAGVIVVAASGNDASSALFAPASYNGVVSVSATNISSQLASYSNFGTTIDVAAPGGDSGDLNGDGFFDGVLSTGADDSTGSIVFNYRFAAGTSMASPHMAGVVALMKSVYPDLTPAILDTMLQNGELTNDLGSPGRDNSFGYGLINAQKAVTAAVNAATPTPPPPPAAELQVSPLTLNMGIALTSAQLNISNSGGGTLDITSVTNDSGGWLSVSADVVDANGLGSYAVNVNRSGLLDGVYTAAINIISSAGSQTVSVIMQVNSVATSDNAGFHYIELVDMETMQLFDRVISSGTNGVYEFTFPGVPLGMYHIRAGSDLDNDEVLCETGDACGAYPTLDILSQHIVIDGSATSLNGLDFTTGYIIDLTNP